MKFKIEFIDNKTEYKTKLLILCKSVCDKIEEEKEGVWNADKKQDV